MNIYVSPSLRRQMKEYDNVINWSKIAADAFVQAMKQRDEHVALRKHKDRFLMSIYNAVKSQTDVMRKESRCL